MTRALGRERSSALHSADYYKQHRRQLIEKGTVKKEHADSTKENIYGVMMKWTRYCKFIGEDRLDLLVKSTKEDIMTFFKWVLDTYHRVRKRSSLHEYWRLWRMLYRKSIGVSLHAKVLEEVNDYIDGYLTRKYKLDTNTREKPVMNVDDILLILHHHWAKDSSVFPDERQRLQLAFLLLLSAYTATRPGALVYSTIDRRKQREHYIGWENDESGHEDTMGYTPEDVKTLCYEDVTLLLLPNPNAERDILVMEVTLKYTKGWKKKPNPKTYILTEVNELIFDPIVPMVAIAILDNAFEPKFRSVEEIFRTRVRAPRNSLELKWKPEKLKVPIFRQAEGSSCGVVTSDTKALRYHTYLYYLQRLGFAAGFMQILGAYVVRRGAGEAVDTVATQAQLQQVMGHRDAGIYQAYINRRVQCDVQAAFLGKPSSNALFRTATHMSRYADPRAPTKPSTTDLDIVKIDPEIVRLRQLRDHLSKEVRQESGTLKNAEVDGTKLYRMYKNTEDALRCTKAKLRKSAQKEARQRFFDTIDTQEINRQLDPSFLDLDDCACEINQIEHALEERTLAAELLCEKPTDPTAPAQLEHRMKTITTLIALCQRREAPQRCKKDSSWGVVDGTAASELFPTACEKTQCLFCFGNQRQPQEVRLYHYATIYKARNHVKSHLRAYEPDQPVPCPHLTCQRVGVLLIDREHFIDHAAAEHGYDIFRKSQ